MPSIDFGDVNYDDVVKRLEPQGLLDTPKDGNLEEINRISDEFIEKNKIPIESKTNTNNLINVSVTNKENNKVIAQFMLTRDQILNDDYPSEAVPRCYVLDDYLGVQLDGNNGYYYAAYNPPQSDLFLIKKEAISAIHNAVLTGGIDDMYKQALTLAISAQSGVIESLYHIKRDKIIVGTSIMAQDGQHSRQLIGTYLHSSEYLDSKTLVKTSLIKIFENTNLSDELANPQVSSVNIMSLRKIETKVQNKKFANVYIRGVICELVYT